MDEEFVYKRVKPIWWVGKEFYLPSEDIVIPPEEIKHFCEKYLVCIPEKRITLAEITKRAEKNPKGVYARFLRLLFFQQRMKPEKEYMKYARWFIKLLPRKYREKYSEEELASSIAAAIERSYWECRTRTGVWCGQVR